MSTPHDDTYHFLAQEIDCAVCGKEFGEDEPGAGLSDPDNLMCPACAEAEGARCITAWIRTTLRRRRAYSTATGI